MHVSSIYVCPVRGLANLEPPEPRVLGRAAGTASALGVDRLVIPVLEEALLQPKRHKVSFLDGILRCLDQADDAGMSLRMMAPAQRIMGMDWVAPYLVRGHLDEGAAPVFVDGAMRALRPYAWWVDPSIVRKRLLCFRELTAAVGGHPALTGWIVMDRCLEWAGPDPQTADLILKSYCAEIRDHHEGAGIDLSIGLRELLLPTPVRRLVGEVDRLFLRGLDSGCEGLMRPGDLTEEIFLAAYLVSMARWLFEKPVALEMGWTMTGKGIRDETLAAAHILGQQGTSEVVWTNLMAPERRLLSQPPWNREIRLGETALLDEGGDPKDRMDLLIARIRSGEEQPCVTDFIDMDDTAYMADPETHLGRLWNHFREAVGFR